jgi:hypothetical protein
MALPSREVRLYLIDEAIDAQALADRAYKLRRELIELGALPIQPTAAEETPSGSKAADPIAVGALILSIANSPTLIAALSATIQSWMSRTATQRIRIKAGEKELEVAGPLSSADVELIRDFVKRYFDTDD